MSDSNLIEQNLYFELDTSNGEQISEEQFQSFVDRVITPRFPDGLTIFDTEGEEQEKSKVVSLLVEDNAFERIATVKILQAYQQQFPGVEVRTVSDRDDLKVNFDIEEDLIDNDLNPELIQVDLFFGRDISGVGEVSESQFQSFVEREITPRFPDGLTIFDTKGQFQDTTGTVVEESSKVVSLIIEDTETNEVEIDKIANEYIEQFQQESVLLVANEDLTIGFGGEEDLIDNDLNPELIQVDLFFGRDISGVGEVSESQFQSFVEREITPRFPDGLTIFDTKGQFQDTTGTVVEESSKVVSLIIEDTETNEVAIDKIVNEYIEQFKQESVLTVINEDIQTQNNLWCDDESDTFAISEVDCY